MNVGMWGRIVLRVGLVALSNSALASGGGEGGGGMGAIWPSIRPLGDLTLSPCLGEGPEPGVVISFDSDCITVVLIRDLRGACCFLASSALRATVPLNGRAATAVALCTCSVAMQQRNSAPTMLATDATTLGWTGGADGAVPFGSWWAAQHGGLQLQPLRRSRHPRRILALPPSPMEPSEPPQQRELLEVPSTSHLGASHTVVAQLPCVDCLPEIHTEAAPPLLLHPPQLHRPEERRLLVEQPQRPRRKPNIKAVPQSGLLGRLQAFLPTLQAANADLAQLPPGAAVMERCRCVRLYVCVFREMSGIDNASLTCCPSDPWLRHVLAATRMRSRAAAVVAVRGRAESVQRPSRAPMSSWTSPVGCLI